MTPERVTYADGKRQTWRQVGWLETDRPLFVAWYAAGYLDPDVWQPVWVLAEAAGSPVGICGHTVTGIGNPLVCDLPAGHPGWHGCEQPYAAAPMGRPWLTSTVSRCHWRAPRPGEDAS